MNTDLSGKKVLYVITKSNFGGAQKYVYELAIAAKHKGALVAVACGGKGELIKKLNEHQIQTFEVGGLTRDISIKSEIKALYSLAHIIRDFDPDVVHFNSSKAGLLGTFISRLLSVPRIIFTAHGWPFLEDRSKWWKLMAWAGSYFTGLFSHRIILVSEHDLRQTKMPGVKSKCKLIHIAVSDFPLLSRDETRLKLFSEETIKNHQHNVWLVTTAELVKNKNHTLAIDAIAEFNSTHTTKIFYTVIGEGELETTLKEQADMKGLNDYVNFIGYLENASQYLLGFDMFILPSKKEGLPYALLEAGKAGLPCIASRIGGIPEVIIDKETGLLIDPNNHMTVVAALDFLLTNSNKRSEYSDNLSALIEAEYKEEIMLAKTWQTYL